MILGFETLRGTKTHEVVKRLELEVKEKQDSEEFKSWLEAMAKFHKYSWHNQLLIWSQNPEATLVRGYVGWQKDFGRHVKYGEHGILILRPNPYKKEVVNKKGETETAHGVYFNWTTVFDVSQTEGKPLPEWSIETDDSPIAESFLPNLINLAVEMGIKVEIVDNLRAYGESWKGLIKLRSTNNCGTQVCTTIHEIAHERAHGDKERRELPKVVKEAEAEAITYVVCSHFYIPNSASNYLASWLKDGNYNLLDSLPVISKVSQEIIDKIGGYKNIADNIT